MSTLTPNYQFILPAVNSPLDENRWGGQLNTNSSNLDDLLTSINASNIGPTAPIVPASAAPTAGMLWLDTSAGGDFYFLKIYDGTGWATIGSLNTTLHEFSQNNVSYNLRVITATGTYTVPTGLSFANVTVIGGGGAGGAANQGGSGACGGGGGGAGGTAKRSYTAAQLGASQPITIGAAGTIVPANTGGPGGTTTFGSGSLLLTANGGLGGEFSLGLPTSGAPGGAGGTASGGTINIQGAGGNDGFGFYQSVANNYGLGGNGANSSLGGGGGRGGKITRFNGAFVQPGQVGIIFGAGGGGSSSVLSGNPDPAPGNGAAGVVIIEEFF